MKDARTIKVPKTPYTLTELVPDDFRCDTGKFLLFLHSQKHGLHSGARLYSVEVRSLFSYGVNYYERHTSRAMALQAMREMLQFAERDR